MTNIDPTRALLEELARWDLHPTTIQWTGKIVRFRDGKEGDGKKSGWYVAYADTPKSAAFGSWKRNIQETWTHRVNGQSPDKVSKQELARMQSEWAENRKRREKEQEESYAAVAVEAQSEWGRALNPDPEHPYLVTKGITDPRGIRQDDHGNLLIPAKDWESNAITTLQRIRADGQKRFMDGGKANETRTTIGAASFQPGVRVFVTEGWATGWSVHEATQCPVIVCFHAGNIAPAVAALRSRYPESDIIVAADNDQWSTLRRGEKEVANPGLVLATEAVEGVERAYVAYPRFPDDLLDQKPTDFNDLHRLVGTPAVLECLSMTSAPAPAPPAPTAPEPQPDEPIPSEPTPEELNPGHTDPPPPPETVGPPGQPTWLDTAPFRVVGYDGGTYYYLPRGTGQIHSLAAAQHRREHLLTLASVSWWEHYFPSRTNVDWTAAADALFRAAERRGVFRPENLRGRGCWRSESAHGDRQIIIHLGDRLLPPESRTFVDPESFDDPEHRIYERQRALPGPSRKRALTLDEANGVMGLCEDLLWYDKASGYLLAGWLTLAPLCGWLEWRPHIWIIGNAGSGKAQPHSAKVLTPSGWRTMGELAPGDEVTTPDNRRARVLNTYPQGEQDVYEIEFADGRKTRATSDHLWKVRQGGRWRLVTTEDMVEIKSRGTRHSTKLAVPLTDPVEVTRGRRLNLPIHPYVLGAFLGDGGLSDPAGVALHSFDPEVPERVRSLLPEGVTLSERGTEGVYGICGLNDLVPTLDTVGHPMRRLLKELRTLGFAPKATGPRSWEKWIPEAYLDASVEDRWALLQGLMDTDGTVGRHGSISFSTVSPMLRDAVVRLVRSLGGIARVYTRRPSYPYNGEQKEGRESYTVLIRIREREKVFSLPRKRQRLEGGGQYDDCLYLNVKKITKVGREECSCIRIDHPDRLYLTDDFTVTHNTTVLERLVIPMVAGMAKVFEGSTTEAGIRQRLGSDALPVIYDEAEQDTAADTRVQNILGLARSASSSATAEVAKGGSHGSASSFHIRSAFCLSSIGGNVRQEADKTRISLLQLRGKGAVPPEERRAHWARYAPRLARVNKDMGRSLLSRTLQWARDGRLDETIDVFRGRAAVHLGDARAGDQYGTLLAGAWTLMSDYVPESIDADTLLQSEDLNVYVQEQKPAGRRVIDVILQAETRVEVTSTGPKVLALGQLIDAVWGEIDASTLVGPDDAKRHLRRLGIIVYRDDRGDDLVGFANSSEWIQRSLTRTPYSDSWARVLKGIDGVQADDQPRRYYSGLVSRTTIVPRYLLHS